MASAEIDYSYQTVITDLDTEETSAFATDYSEVDLGTAIGVGLTYDVTDRVYVRGDYTQYDLLDVELNSANIGVGFRF